MIKAVMFDLDGTMLNRDASVQIFLENQYQRFQHQLQDVPKKKYIERFNILEKRGYVWKDFVYQQLAEEFSLSDVTWETLLEDYVNQFQYFCVPFDGLSQVLSDLKERGFLLGIISNGRGKFQMDNIERLGIEHFFDAILISEWEGIKKPDPAIFHRALQLLEVTAAESVFIGDHPVNDVQAAMNVGMKGIWKKDHQWQETNADIIVNDLAEIPNVIERWNKGADEAP